MRISKLSAVITVIILALAFQSSGYTQGNLVNLTNWTIETATPQGAYANPPGSATILSATAALLYSGQNVFTNVSAFGPNNPTISGSLSTTPGGLYEIFCTLQDNSQWLCEPTLTFGNFTTNFSLPNLGGPNPPFGGPPVTVDFTIMALSSSTVMSINPGIDDYPGQVSLSNLSVTQVPEVSTARLLGLGGGVWLFLYSGRQFLQKQKRS